MDVLDRSLRVWFFYGSLDGAVFQRAGAQLGSNVTKAPSAVQM